MSAKAGTGGRLGSEERKCVRVGAGREEAGKRGLG